MLALLFRIMFIKNKEGVSTTSIKFICSDCGAEVSAATRYPKCRCGGLWSLAAANTPFNPEDIDRDEWSIFRYRKHMALLDDAWRDITLGEGMTPVIRFDTHVLLKMDYLMPTLSYKDRGAAVLVAHCKSIGVDRVAQDSSGNAGNSVAAYCGRAGIKCDIFVPEGTSPKKIDMIKAHGASVHVISGSRDHCADVCREFVEQEGVYYANHVYNPLFYEGTKTYIYEVYEQCGRIPHNLFIPVGNGTLFIGVVHALEEMLSVGLIKEMPQIFALQSERCMPLKQAYQKGMTKPAEVIVSPTLAEGIAIGQPMRGKEILALAARHGVRFLSVPEDKILPARALLAAKGIYCEHTTAANYAAYLAYCEENGPLEDTLITMCGAGLKSDH